MTICRTCQHLRPLLRLRIAAAGALYDKLVAVACLLLQPCSAGDSAPYERRNTADNDVVIVAALRTPLTKVRQLAAGADSPFNTNMNRYCMLCARIARLLDALIRSCSHTLSRHTAWPCACMHMRMHARRQRRAG